MIKLVHHHSLPCSEKKKSNGTLNGHRRSTRDVNKMHKNEGNKNISKEVIHVYRKSESDGNSFHLTQGDETASLYCALQTLIIQTRES